MLMVRKADERGFADHGWLESFHTFSFAGYQDEKFMGFGALRVINEDRVQPAKGFETHSHRDMEILSYVVKGALEHKDSMGNGSTIRPGELQLMRAGTGVTHSEFNASKTEVVHFLQIWIVPDEMGLEPAYEQIAFPAEERQGMLRLIASREGSEGSVRVHQNVSVLGTLLDADQSVKHSLSPSARAWVQVVRGDIVANGDSLSAGDGMAVSHESSIELRASSSAEALLFDLN